MKNDDLKFLQNEELNMAKIIIEICRKYELEYYIMGGTLLGAKRHEGFIPWDDDLDIGLKRDDYEVFMSIAEKELFYPYSLHHHKNDTSHIYPYMRIQNDTVSLRRENTRNKTIQKLWVDIFPLDGAPSSGIKRLFWEKALYVLRGLRNLSCFDELVNINKEYTGLKKLIVTLGLKTNVQNVINTNKIIYKIDNFLKKWDLDRYPLIANPMGGHWFKEVYPKDYYSSSVEMNFEDIKMSAPVKYERILEQMYGDYMKLPKEEDRNWHGTTLLGVENQ